ncbi:NUDIX domain-containing protein [Sphingobium sp.]|uniref:NUDIX domain-containing protein n=1 Tax=Sphingobium sp. TaxID=1912891 RepID=UPI003B3BA6BE
MTSILSTRPIYQGWLNLIMVAMRGIDGTHYDRHVVEMNRAVVVLPYDPDRRVALVVSMPRTPVMLAGLPDLLEPIAGILEDEPADCARREAMEEAGVRLGDLTHLGQIWSIPTVVTERIDYFLAEYRAQDRIAAGGGLDEEQENITVHEMTLDDLWTRLAQKRIGDGKLAITLMALRLRRPDLFSVPVA